jgi:GT2 family glycosyltransferase
MALIAAVIATRFEPPQLTPLLETLRADGVLPVVVHDTGTHAPDWSLYRLWNDGVRQAIERGAEYVCVMNDDVTILPGTLNLMAGWLEEVAEYGVLYPDCKRATSERFGHFRAMITQGTWGAGAMTGFCFMFRADLDVPFDEKYQLWYGDDDFEERVRAKGLLVARIDGLPIDHAAMGSTSLVDHETVMAWIENDRRRWETRTYYTVQTEAVTA